MKKKVPFFDYPRLWLDDKDQTLKVIDEVSSSGGFILQRELRDFEIELAAYTGSVYSVGVANATDAMEIFLEALGLEAGDEIIISSHTMLATASAIKVAGATPIPVDIGADNLIGVDAIEEAISPRTVGVMPTHLNGRTCAMEPILKLAEKNGLFVVEDAAQSLGSKYKGQNAGTFGLASCISFFPAKVLGCFGDGGAVLVNDEKLFREVYQIHDHGRDFFDGEVKRWGRNSRLDNLQAAILSSKLKNYPNVLNRRREIAQLYDDRLRVIEELHLPDPPSKNSDHYDVFQNYELTANYRDKLKMHLSNRGIGTLIQWGGTAIHQYTDLGFNQHCPKTDEFFKKCIMLPMNMFISDDDVHYICDSIFEFYRG